MKTVGVREFRDHGAPSYLAGSEPIAFSNRGTVIGFYIPLRRDPEETNVPLNVLVPAARKFSRTPACPRSNYLSYFRSGTPFVIAGLCVLWRPCRFEPPASRCLQLFSDTLQS